MRAQCAYTADSSSKSNPPQRTSDPKPEESQTFEEQIESLSAVLQQLCTTRKRLDSEMREIKREYNRSKAALDKLQREADQGFLSLKVRCRSLFGHYPVT